MSSSLQTEKLLSLSATLAATIGLEEALLFQLLDTASDLQTAQQGYYQLHSSQLETLLPFWNSQDIQRVTKSLVDKGLIVLESAPYTQSQKLLYRFDQPAQASQPAGIEANSHPLLGKGANRISPYWQPSEETLRQLVQQGVETSFVQGQVAEFVTYWRERGDISYSWPAKFMSHVMRSWRRHQAQTPFVDQQEKQPSTMNKSWSPSPDALEILCRAGIPPSFIDDAIPEFVLYWQERGDAQATWNSKFIRHVKQQWARYTHTMKNDSEPVAIDEQWQPDAAVYDILSLANIDNEFARQQIPEFILYWRERNELHSSWTSKFLQHVKYQWAKQHQLATTGASHEGRHTFDQSGQPAADGFIAKHTDRSWADGL